MFWLISRLQAPEEELCQVSTKERQRYSPIPLSLPTGNFLNPLPLRVRAKTLVSSRGGGRSAMATSEHSTAPRSSPAGQHGYTGVGASQYGRLSQVQVSPAKKSGDKRMGRRGRGGVGGRHYISIPIPMRGRCALRYPVIRVTSNVEFLHSTLIFATAVARHG